VVALLTAWNATQSVDPSLDTSHARGRAVARIEAAVPEDAHVLLSSTLAGRLADDGYEAEGGFPALRRAVEAGADLPGVAALVEEASGGPVFISSRAFSLTAVQARFLGTTGAGIWERLRACCTLRPVLRLTELSHPEVLYRLISP
jgi:hypothetical protein